MINVRRGDVLTPSITSNYRTLEVIEALGTVFNNKCYLCERKEADPSTFVVEHFIGQTERIDLVYQWSNLYPACDSCNSIKPKRIPEGGYLDPCEDSDDVESEIVYLLEFLAYDNPKFISATSTPMPKVANTVQLLKLLHYGNSSMSKKKGESLRKVVKEHAVQLITEAALYLKAVNDVNHIEIEKRKYNLERILSRNSGFTMLLRSLGTQLSLQEFFD